MHHDERLMRMEARLGRLPDDGETWLEMARYVARRRILPGNLDREAHLERLVALWGGHPTERALEVLVMPLLRLVADSAPDRDAPACWTQRAARAPRSGALYDPISGLPVHVRRRVDDATMVLVPGEGTEASPVYLDHRCVSAGSYRRFLRATGEPPPPAPLPEDDAVAAAVEDPGSRARYAWWVGGRLPESAELDRARELGVLVHPASAAEAGHFRVVVPPGPLPPPPPPPPEQTAARPSLREG